MLTYFRGSTIRSVSRMKGTVHLIKQRIEAEMRLVLALRFEDPTGASQRLIVGFGISPLKA